MNSLDPEECLEPTFGDGAHKIGKALLSAVPVVGGPAVELFSVLIAAPLEKRRDEWLTSCVSGLKRLEEEFAGFKMEQLAEKEAFLTTFMHATKITTANHSKEKRRALRNAVLNSASPTPPDEDMQLIFVNLVDSFTSWHLRLMLACEDKWGWRANKEQENTELPSPHLIGPCPLIEALFPELAGKHDFYDHLLKDLVNRGLVVISKKPMSVKTIIYCTLVITPMGQEFRKFISSPMKNRSVWSSCYTTGNS